MHIEQCQWTQQAGWSPHPPGTSVANPELVLVFGPRRLMHDSPALSRILNTFPEALISGCSTAGEIFSTHVSDDALVCTAVAFENSCCRLESVTVESPEDSFAQGMALAGRFTQLQLKHLLVFSDGLHVNGTNLIKGMQTILPDTISITGGLAADGEKFEETYVLLNGLARQRVVAAVGLYGEQLRVGFGTFGGWDPFGPERLITRSSGNILYELDGVSALNLYKQYLGDYAMNLPASALLFPLSIRSHAGGQEIVRTILGVDEADQSMIFAGDMPEGYFARLMTCNMDRLIDGAATAGRQAATSLEHVDCELALLISCVGRKMVLRQRVEEEVEAVREILGPNAILNGFYSYGEISPLVKLARCELLNQTMTITALSEQPGP